MIWFVYVITLGAIGFWTTILFMTPDKGFFTYTMLAINLFFLVIIAFRFCRLFCIRVLKILPDPVDITVKRIMQEVEAEEAAKKAEQRKSDEHA